jgi:hypothetical protein
LRIRLGCRQDEAVSAEEIAVRKVVTTVITGVVP